DYAYPAPGPIYQPMPSPSLLSPTTSLVPNHMSTHHMAPQQPAQQHHLHHSHHHSTHDAYGQWINPTPTPASRLDPNFRVMPNTYNPYPAPTAATAIPPYHRDNHAIMSESSGIPLHALEQSWSSLNVQQR
ncbi:10796_t:CDS:1, partial [Acaulospora colombiana]